MATGSISLEEFEAAVNDFLDISRLLGDTWQICFSKGGRYLKKLQTVCIPKTAFTDNRETEQEALDEMDENSFSVEQVMDDASLAGAPTYEQLAYNFEFHIVYSMSYSVPVLYFNAYNADGSLLPLSELWDYVPEYYQACLREERWTVLTQQEHPLLGRPFFQLHPCHTSNLMAKVVKSGEPLQYLVSWMSSVGPVVHLELPLTYVAHMNNKKDLITK